MQYCHLLAFLFLLIVSGCRVGPHYEPPAPAVPEEWKNSQPTVVQAAFVDFWWEVFNDCTLNELEQCAVQNNPTLYAALERVFEARALACVEASNLYPQLFLNPSYNDFGALTQVNLPSGVNIPGLSGGIPPFRIHQMQYMLPLNLNYELDLWGKLRDNYDAAAFNADAQTEAYFSSMLTLTADLASTYFQLRTLDATIDLLKANIETRRKNLELTNSRFNKGLVTYLDVTQAQVDFATVQSNYHNAVRLRRLAENQIAVLTGQIASDFCLAHNPLKGVPPVIPAGIPSTILLQRPDIAQAERAMAAEHALVNSAYASFFPSISLTGALGYLSPDASQFTKWISRYWMLGANGSQMVFDGGRDSCTLKAAWARFRESSGFYQQQVLAAFREVEDALNNIEQQAKEEEQLKIASEASRKAVDISLNRYRNGVSIYLEVVENERLQLEVEVERINRQGALYISTVQLIKALGGSWETGESPQPTSEEPGCDT